MKMKKIVIFALLLLAVVAVFAYRRSMPDDDIGGRLPMIITDWTDIPDSDVFFLLDYSHVVPEGLYIDEVLATIGEDQPVPTRVVSQMLAAVGLEWAFPDGGMLTLGQAQAIMHHLRPAADVIYITDANRDMYISYALWVGLFVQYLKDCDYSHGMQAANVVVLGQDEGQLYTSLGTFGIKDINLGAFINQAIRVLHRDRQIVAVLGVTDLSPTLHNVMVTRLDAVSATIAVGGVARDFALAISDTPTLISNVQIYRQQIIAITPAEAVISGTIERVRAHSIDIREWGAVPLCPYFAVYDAAGTLHSPQDLLVGTHMAEFHIIGGRVGAAVIMHQQTPTNIRVAINTTGFGGLVHPQVTVTSTGAFTVSGGGVTRNFAAGQHFTVSETENADLWGSTRLYISPNDPINHRLEIVGLTRNWPGGQTPQYRGTLEIARNNGGFVIVNVLCIEDYLQAVIPSEMPTAHGLEAAKVQAITARSFALHQIYQNRFRQFGAHVDDSVMSQVYNNIPETSISIAAVAATRGQVLTVDGELVIANYFSTSGGMTANFGEVWARGGQFPSESPAHLRALPQFDMQQHSPGNLREERYADAFFRSHDIPGFDRQFAWFRWEVQLTAAQLSQSINGNIATRQAANPALIQVLDANGASTNARVNSIGQLQHIEIKSRGQGGNIMEIILTGTEARVLVRTEFNIRTLLSPGNIPVVRHDGSTVAGLSLMPSAFFALEQRGGVFYFFGGGNGHGVGMSQNGVRSLVEMGKNYREIIAHYYPGTVIMTIK